MKNDCVCDSSLSGHRPAASAAACWPLSADRTAAVCNFNGCGDGASTPPSGSGGTGPRLPQAPSPQRSYSNSTVTPLSAGSANYGATRTHSSSGMQTTGSTLKAQSRIFLAEKKGKAAKGGRGDRCEGGHRWAAELLFPADLRKSAQLARCTCPWHWGLTAVTGWGVYCACSPSWMRRWTSSSSVTCS